MHVVIVGNGVAGTEAALAIRRRLSPQNARITLISEEHPYFFSRTALMYAYMDTMQRRDLEPYEREMYRRQQIERIQNRVVDINADAHTITLRSGATLSYDRLLLAVGARPRMVPFEGLDEVKDGLVNFVSMQDLDHCERLTWSTEEAVVLGGGLIGVELAESFVHHGLKVSFVVREPYFWPAALAADEGELIGEEIRRHGIDLIVDQELQVIESDEAGRVSGVRLSDGRHLPAQMLGVAIGVVPNVDWLRKVKTSPELGRGIRVDRSFRTSLPDVFAAGDCAEIGGADEPPLLETIWYSAKLQGQRAASAILGDEVHYSPPIFYNSSKFFGIEYTTVGECVGVPSGTRSLFRSHPKRPITQRILFNEDRVLGFSMLGSRWDHTLLQQWIAERRPLDYVREHLHRAQFDVEFGRVDLTTFKEEERTL
ncbi:NAD(P)/FAD-dependent oxidoreductase [Lujinxingia vulgaris]|uniref:NAD(P)/FAD-dependent oxidoreductase n=1 Tax=Lujinxingia vulgaris TaxID=2600176 RepID=A0A5C6WY23_9DELT|nr:FAD/NAD(P)-binding oxidoreductase [Lujinxingia vulgaris]TXD34345.1 NAD(P)/FAD-dependent oxidoreductase [Lujinxingia vulgaris]